MASNSSTEYKVVTDKIVSPDEDLIISVQGGVYLGSIEEGNRVATIGEVGEGGSGTVGPTGPTGPTGPAGADGADGADANTGDITFSATTISAPDNTDITIHSDADLEISATGGTITLSSNVAPSVVEINTYVGALVNSARTSSYEPQDRVVATLGDVGVETEFAVVGGSTGTQPTFTGDPLFSGTYIRMSSDLVHFQIQVDFDNITNFGTGQYYVDLPFPAKYGYKFREGCLHDISASKDYAIGGHVFPGESRIYLTSTDTQSGTVFDIPFTSSAPTTLDVADNFHIAGNYIADFS